MFVTFVGSPCSGKTTAAAMAFAQLKDAGLPVEFVPEYARFYIAKMRQNLGLKPEDHLNLSDADQQCILEHQLEHERIMKGACGPSVVVISDTWSLNSLLYMTPERRLEPQVRALAEASVRLPDLVFYTPPLPAVRVLDPNRIHSHSQSLAIDAQIPEVFRLYAPALEPVILEGNSSTRLTQVMVAITERIRG